MMPKVVSLILLSAVSLGAAPPSASTGDALAEPLVKTVAELSVKVSPTGKDFARMTEATLDFARRKSQAGTGFSQDVVHSGLDAIDAGEKLDPKAAEWSALRKELEAYLNPPEQPPPQQKGESKEPPPEGQNQEKKENEGESKDSSSESKQSEKSNEQSKENPSESSDSSQKPPSEDPASKPEDGKPDSSKEDPSSAKGNSAFGEMDKNPRPTPPPSPEGKSSGADENQQVGGQQKKEESGDAAHDPQLVMPLQKLEQLKQQDSPAKLFRLMEGPASPDSAKKGKTW
ncbi:MAG TPA: hypothetical protein PKX00_00640 [Opitutaceae bacterium]|jgi:Ca-activated chloride channel family protein|nr:hypothetical protein [Opitutaceae bacterium]HRE04084.1 hypothetical protein [Opitutaceae bacterium]